ncbi:EndoU domain-containing protein [Streptomyces bacillaris]
MGFTHLPGPGPASGKARGPLVQIPGRITTCPSCQASVRPPDHARPQPGQDTGQSPLRRPHARSRLTATPTATRAYNRALLRTPTDRPKFADQRKFRRRPPGEHTYYVLAGATPVLVHNSNCPIGAGRDLIDGQAQFHIIHGDRTGGGHKWSGQAGKTVFPSDWGTDRILDSVADVATSPKRVWTQQTGKKGALHTKNGNPSRWKIEGNVGGVNIRVIYQPATDRIVTGFPYR